MKSQAELHKTESERIKTQYEHTIKALQLTLNTINNDSRARANSNDNKRVIKPIRGGGGGIHLHTPIEEGVEGGSSSSNSGNIKLDNFMNTNVLEEGKKDILMMDRSRISSISGSFSGSISSPPPSSSNLNYNNRYRCIDSVAIFLYVSMYTKIKYFSLFPSLPLSLPPSLSLSYN